MFLVWIYVQNVSITQLLDINIANKHKYNKVFFPNHTYRLTQRSAENEFWSDSKTEIMSPTKI